MTGKEIIDKLNKEALAEGDSFYQDNYSECCNVVEGCLNDIPALCEESLSELAYGFHALFQDARRASTKK